MLNKPEIGEHIAVVSDYSEYMSSFVRSVPRIRTLYGEVVASELDDDPEP